MFLFEKDAIKIQELPLSSAVAYFFVHLNHIHSITNGELKYSTDILENVRLENGSLFMVNGAYVSDLLFVCKCIAHMNSNATFFRWPLIIIIKYYTMYRTRIHDKKITFATNEHGNWENPESLLRY